MAGRRKALTEEQLQEVITALQSGTSTKAIAEQLNVTQRTVQGIKKTATLESATVSVSSTEDCSTKSEECQEVSDQKDRTRYWATEVYEDSAPENWRSILADEHIPTLMIKHDKDVNPDGEPKKVHWHVLLLFDSKKSERQVQEVSDKLSKVKVIKCKSVIGYARYLTHKDNPEKYQYDEGDVVEMNGADYHEIVDRVSDNVETLSAIETYINEHDIFFYCDLSEYCRNSKPEWYRLITTYNNAREHIKAVLRAREYKQKQGYVDMSVTDTPKNSHTLETKIANAISNYGKETENK